MALDPFVAEICIFPYSFLTPTGFANCSGQLLPLSQNTALFSLLGTTYGGDGKSTFALPDFQGNVPIHFGQGPGLSQRFLGETGGAESITLLQSEMPAHTHSLQAANVLADSQQPSGNSLARGAYSFQGQGGSVPMYFTGAPDVQMAPQALAPTGGSLPHNNMQPYLTLRFCIALQGVFPPRK